jgi:hypothetical protein
MPIVKLIDKISQDVGRLATDYTPDIETALAHAMDAGEPLTISFSAKIVPLSRSSNIVLTSISFTKEKIKDSAEKQTVDEMQENLEFNTK